MKLACSAALAALLPVTAVLADQPVTINFAAEIGGQPFASDATFNGLGMSNAEVNGTDFRLYASDVAMIATDGSRVPVTLTESAFQHDGTALLDFEDGSAARANGTAPVNTVLTGTVPEGDYTGVSFKIGVPFEVNHGDPTVAPTPLNLTSMFWNWRGGYKFVRIDMVPTDRSADGPKGWFLHLGSTMCASDGKTDAPAAPCKNPNLMEVTFDGFDPATQVLVIDPAPVVAEVDLRTNTPETSPGCMSFPNDSDCNTVLPKLGLPFNEVAAGEQQLIAVR
ncbi:metallo-mystery pair system four-Cys motif protein [Marivivens donghaensis]|uniref:Metallo-mystery pair system four-Cys motif protein n=1 Tax=Marivivens donghaensis TaxID=1699413 RepID=A0ABX0VTG4_9RHOB|nr:MbnP family copper-binding protein [Marivivens donghaensis]NIY71141.1 metallo-mystery pair system four-Cys motif protein [Marivivens donghaensis]